MLMSISFRYLLAPTNIYLFARTSNRYSSGMARSEGAPRRTAQELKVIRALHAAFWTMMRQFDADLQREHHLSHTEYVPRDWLAEAPDRTMGLSDLAARCQHA